MRELVGWLFLAFSSLCGMWTLSVSSVCRSHSEVEHSNSRRSPSAQPLVSVVERLLITRECCVMTETKQTLSHVAVGGVSVETFPTDMKEAGTYTWQHSPARINFVPALSGLCFAGGAALVGQFGSRKN